MSLKSQLLRTAERARRPLGDAAGPTIDFLRAQVAPDGSFRNRAGQGDLYYTVFGLLAMETLGLPLPAATFAGYLPTFGDGAGLDFVHTSCLARGWSMGPGAPPPVRRAILQRLAAFRTPDGGYAPTAGEAAGTAYGCFLALSTCQDLEADVPDAPALAACLETLRTADGGYTNERTLPFASTPATAGVITMLLELGQPVPPEAAQWLRTCVAPEGGGMVAMPGVPVADLLSTATVLHALGRAAAQPDEMMRAACMGFVLSLLAESGGFRGHVADDLADCEYTLYGLLALGQLVAWSST